MLKARKGELTYAVKVSSSLGASSGHKVADFATEKAILAHLNHSHIPSLVDAFCHAKVNYIVQEFIDGYPLSYYIGSGRRFSEAEVREVLLQLLLILQYLHQHDQPVIHRDLRLSNLMLAGDKIHLIDFGLARFLNSAAVGPAAASPTASSLAAPKHVRPNSYRSFRQAVSPASDLFGAGVVGVDLFTNWVSDPAHFALSWQKLIPASQPFITFLEQLLTGQKYFCSAADAYHTLKSLP